MNDDIRGVQELPVGDEMNDDIRGVQELPVGDEMSGEIQFGEGLTTNVDVDARSETDV